MKKYKLTNPQKSIWVTEEFYKGTPIENIAGTTTIEDKVDFSKLKEAINLFTKNTESFRLKFVNESNIIKQYISDYEELDFELVDVESEKDVSRLEKDFANTPFEIFDSLMFKFKLFKFKDGHGGFIVAGHHLLVDAWSCGLVISNVLKIYDSLVNGIEFNEELYSYIDYIDAEQEYLSSNKFLKDKEFWDKQFESIPETATIPGSLQSKDISSNAKRKLFNIPEKTMNLINTFCKDNKISPFNFFMGTYSLYISRVSNLDEFVIGTPVLNRSNVKEKHTIGMFVSVVPFKVNINEEKSFTDFACQISSNFFSIFKHQKYPYQTFLEDLRKQNSNMPNLFNIMLSYQNMRTETKTTGTKYETNWAFNGHISDDIDIHFFDINDSGTINVAYDYRTSKYTAEDIYALHSRILHIINQILENDTILLKDIEIVTPSEKEEILYKFNDTKMDYPKDKTIVELFEEQVEKTPDNIAVVFEDQKLTYKELNEKANSLAHYLVSNGIKRSEVITVYMNKNILFIISILAIQKAGCAYVPVNCSYPINRLEYIFNNSHSSMLLTDQKIDIPSINLMNLDFSKYSKNNLNNGVSSSDLSYIIYTSGSTGNPKGVMITHRNLINFLYNFNGSFNNKFSSNDICLSLTNISFDVSVAEIFTPLVFGSTLVLYPENILSNLNLLCNTIINNKITFLYIPPTILSEVFSMLQGKPVHINKLLVGVSSIKNKLLNNFLLLNPNMEIINGYGPTEATICSTFYKYVKSDFENDIVPIGQALKNNSIFIIHKSGNLQPNGVLGELCVSGDNVGKGYIGNNALTSKSFTNGFKFLTSSTYHTGDIAFYNNNGIISFVGRNDSQIKFRGYRIELEEINNKIKSISGVENAITLIKAINGRDFICSYLTVVKDLTDKEIKQYLKEILPLYMIPSYIVIIDKMPLTVNGKIDINNLPAPQSVTYQKEFALPRNEIDKKLIDIISNLLNISSISMSDNFFELGGDSLSAINLCAQIQKEFNAEVFVKDILDHSSIKEISDIVLNISKSSKTKAISRINKSEYYQTSFAQKRMYFTSSIAGNDTVLYNIPGGVILEGTIDIKKLEECFKVLILRHESLRTYFDLIDGQVVQKIIDDFDFKLDILNDQNFEEVHSLFNEFIKPFDLSKAPLFRASLVNFTNGKCALFVDMHHIISDGTSMSIMIDELCKLYNGESLPELKITYKDFAAFENKRLTFGEFKEAESYWVHQFEDEIPILNLPTKTQRPAEKCFEGKKIYSSINFETFNSINTLAQKFEVTPYMILLAAYYVLLYKYTSQNDIVVGAPVVGRDTADTYNLVGMFVNSLALREKIDSNNTFKHFLLTLKEDLLNSYKYQMYPFDELVNKLQIKRDPSRNPLFDTMFVYQNNGYKTLNFNNIESEIYNPDIGISKFDLSVEVIPNNNGAILSFEYATHLFEEDFINNFSCHYLNILNSILLNANTKISEIEMLSENEKNKLLYEFNNIIMDYPKDKTIVEIFEEQVKKSPDKIAIVFENQKLTYKELNAKANSLAHYLVKNQLVINNVVGIMLNRSLDMIISILAVLKAGGIYTLIDTTFPSARVNYILSNCKAKFLIYNNLASIESIDLENIKDIDITPLNYSLNTNNLSHINSPSDDFAIIYTSGSTGKPKGVLLHNEGFINLVYSFKDILELSSSKKHLGFASISFDMFAVELFSSILLGRTLYLLNEEEIKNPILTSNIIIKNNIDFLICTPTKLELLLSNENMANCLKCLKGFQLGGEVFTPELYKKICNLTNAKIYNGYGPTEITACCSNKHVTSEDSINIGTPIPNMKIYVLDKDMNLCPIGVPGEICVAGVGVSHGYIFDDTRTSKSFVNFKTNNEIIYKTGDIAFYNSNGELEYIGRNDFQVKINGLRIELHEIEKQINSITDVKSCVVISDKAKTHLKAFVTSDSTLSIPAIRKRLAEKLPSYMIPKFIVQIDVIPMTSNGKVDRTTLDSIISEHTDDIIEYVAPENEIQEKFCSIWENILETKVGIDNDLFELGADSLTAIRFKVEALNEGIDIPYSDIFKYKTIRNLSKSKTEEIQTASIKDFDYTNINKTLSKNKLKLNYKFNINKNNNVLLLGSNGFVGMHIIDSFIKNDSGTIYCLMRDKNGKGALNRFLDVLHFYFGNTLDSYIGNRIIVLKGDILKENFGLSETNYKKIIENISVIINSAANVKHFGDFNKFKNINIDAIKKTIAFCEKYSKRLIHLSTLSISGNLFLDNTVSKEKLTNEKKFYFSERNLFVNQSLDNVYTRSKFEAEKIVLDEISNSKLDGLILRLGNITSRFSDGKFQINPENNAFTSRLKSFAALGAIPKYILHKEIEFTPVDLCANAIIKALQYTNKNTSVLHIYNRNHIRISTIVSVLKSLNFSVKVLDDKDFSEHINNSISNKNTQNYLNGIVNDLSMERKLVYNNNIHIKSDFSIQFLLHCKFKWSKINRNYLIRYITYLNSINFFTKD